MRSPLNDHGSQNNPLMLPLARKLQAKLTKGATMLVGFSVHSSKDVATTFDI
jgi:hypothetical protein